MDEDRKIQISINTPQEQKILEEVTAYAKPTGIINNAYASERKKLLIAQKER